MPAAVALPIAMGVSAATGLAGSLIQGSAAKSAAQTQQTAAIQAGQKVVDATNAANPGIREAADDATTRVVGMADETAGNVDTAAKNANSLLNPYTGLGQNAVNALALRQDELTKAPTMADLQIDPGFLFRLQQGEQTINRSAAARGGSVSGSALKDLTNYSQDAASQETAAAFNRLMQSRQQAYGILSGEAGMGQAAAGQQGANLMNAGEWGGAARNAAAETGANLRYGSASQIAQNTISAAGKQGEFLTQGANASAAGTIGSANATASGLTGAGSSVMNALLISKLLSPKAAVPATK